MTPALKLTAAEVAALTASVAIEIAASQIDEDARYTPKRLGTFRHDNPGLPRDPTYRAAALAGGRRAYGSTLARFKNAPVTQPVSRVKAELHPRHPAVRHGHTMFPSRVFDASQRDRVLISGINNAKIGKKVTKGPWRGFPIYVLSLEERATCPRSCAVWAACYGNAMPMAVRFRNSSDLISRLEFEITKLHAMVRRPRGSRFGSHGAPGGFVVRLHVLGDFPDIDYLWHWADWSDRFDTLHVWGYTAHAAESEIGGKIALMNRARPDRWQVRFSVAPETPHAPMQASAIWDKASMVTTPGTVICPQELGKTQTCGSCALCWNPNANGLRVLFLGHGKAV